MCRGKTETQQSDVVDLRKVGRGWDKSISELQETVLNPKWIGISVVDILWCLGRELNPHRDYALRDFKSLASTNSATQAMVGLS
jgi:hypothetical protein